MTPREGGGLKKELGLLDVYAISTGAMFSSGFFLLPGLAAAQTGPSVALAYLVAGVFILPAMLSVAELATAMPRAGGAYYFLDRSMGPLVGTIGGLGTWLALVLKSAFALVGMGAYLAIYFDVPIKPLAVAVTLLFMVINLVGAKETSGMQRWLVGTLVVILAFFIVQGLAEIGGNGVVGGLEGRLTPFFAFGFAGFMSTVGFVFVSYAGLTKVASVSEEVRNPDRNIPLGMALSLATAAVIYSVGVFILMAVLPPDELRNDLTPVATAAAAFFDWLPDGVGVGLIVVAAIAAFASTGNAGILSASRYPLAMARDRLVPQPFERVGRSGTPILSILTTAGLMAVAIVVLDVSAIAKLASAFQLLLFSLLNIAVVIMRESRIEAYDPGFRSPLYPWMQIAGILLPLWLVAEMGQMPLLFTIGLVAATSVWYFAYARERVERSGAIFHTFERLGTLRHAGLDHELRGIVREMELRSDDPFDRVVARAATLDFHEPVTFRDVAKEASTVLGRRSGLPPSLVEAGFVAESDTATVPVGHGAAIPHLRVPGLDEPLLVMARCREGLLPAKLADGWSRQHSEEIRAVFFLLSPEDQPGPHLRMLGHLASRVADEGFQAAWQEADDPAELKALFLPEERWVVVRVGEDRMALEGEGRMVGELRLPRGVSVALVRRDGHGLVPRASSVLHDGDEVTLIGEPERLRGVGGDGGPDGEGGGESEGGEVRAEVPLLPLGG